MQRWCPRPPPLPSTPAPPPETFARLLPSPESSADSWNPLPERAPEPEQWAKVSKGSGVAKSVAKSVAPARTSPAAPAGSNAAFDALRKFRQPGG